MWLCQACIYNFSVNIVKIRLHVIKKYDIMFNRVYKVYKLHTGEKYVERKNY